MTNASTRLAIASRLKSELASGVRFVIGMVQRNWLATTARTASRNDAASGSW